jgi:hypothetical protein
MPDCIQADSNGHIKLAGGPCCICGSVPFTASATWLGSFGVTGSCPDPDNHPETCCGIKCTAGDPYCFGGSVFCDPTSLSTPNCSGSGAANTPQCSGSTPTCLGGDPPHNEPVCSDYVAPKRALLNASGSFGGSIATTDLFGTGGPPSPFHACYGITQLRVVPSGDCPASPCTGSISDGIIFYLEILQATGLGGPPWPWSIRVSAFDEFHFNGSPPFPTPWCGVGYANFGMDGPESANGGPFYVITPHVYDLAGFKIDFPFYGTFPVSGEDPCLNIFNYQDLQFHVAFT